MAKRKQTVKQLKNLYQYRNKTIEELEIIQAEIIEGSTEDRTKRVLERFTNDYDLTDLNANDQLALHNLAQIFVRLEDIERQIDTAMVEGDSVKVERLNRIASSLRKDASTIQVDLNITRKARKGDKEQNLVVYIEDLKRRAKKQLEDRLHYIYCEKCKMLLCNVWFLYPKSTNAVKVTCIRALDDTGEICGHVSTVTSDFLLNNDNKNIKDVFKT